MIQYINWLPKLEALKEVVGIENKIAIFTYSDIIKNITTEEEFATLRSLTTTPHKFDFFIIVHHTSGTARIKIDMQEIAINQPNNSIKLAPGQIVEIESISEDFDATVAIMSKNFIDDMMVYINGQITFRPRKGFYIMEHLTEEEMNTEKLFIKAAYHILSDNQNPYRLQVIQHIIMAIFYSSEKIRNIKEDNAPRSNADILSKEFIRLVQENFRRERQLQFYADKLCITPRYLSRVVKESTASSAAEWIERYVILEARALLKSTNMTIQQISDYLNFPSQTFFGKYFKRRIGISPKEYRRIG